MDVAVGGTFDPVHDGHRRLFERALELGDVTVGLTSDEFAPKTRHTDRQIRPFEARAEILENELEELADEYAREFEIRPLEKPTGIATEPQFDYLVVSPETRDGGERINEIRVERGYDPLEVVAVPHVLAADGDLISSTRIIEGEIDEHGTVLSEDSDCP
ncbi:phosphopantetheine adenylyltransferase [Natrarchaeobius halalkaliphilus]|uniref:Phosphopantetheine adenylyltransferase n=1 Tax=Natrarchaeobius halalkaliphilus TaxID=1679091 RepID=A0A3N6LPH4_9EURY|nr:phosphopantetheine adenylyltransferase [Natrarchaeobius halalkaliphilus]RQG91373.1 phosphopantetheine adenylyltransferase [Natrarchaeobius halalkaliphilus]